MKVSRPVAYSAFGSLILGLIWWSSLGPEKPKGSVEATLPKATAEMPNPDFDASDFTTRFDPPKGDLRDIFAPLVSPDSGPIDTSQLNRDLDKIPADFAKGEGNWIFTGYAVVNGQTLACLEDTGSHKANLVVQGATWKASRLTKVGPASISLVGPKGKELVVLRYDPERAKLAKAGPALPQLPPALPAGGPPHGFQPMPVFPNMHGPIGPNIDIQSLPPGIVITQP